MKQTSLVKRTVYRLAALAFSALCLSPCLHAQSGAWTLENCIQYAIDNNITIKQIKLQRESAAIDLNTSQMSRLPDLNAGVGQNWRFGRGEIKSGLKENTTQSNTSFSVNTSIPLFTGFRIKNEIEKNRLELKAATENLEKAKEDLALNIASLFLQVLFNKELVKVNEEQLTLSRAQVEKTKSLVQVGKVPLSQLYDIEAQVAKDEVSLIQANNNRALALLDLAQSLELESAGAFDIYTPEMEAVVAEYADNIQSPRVVFNNAVHAKPVIREQQYRIESAEKLLNMAKSGYSPSLQLNLGYGTDYFYDYDIKKKANLMGEAYSNPSFSRQFRDNSGEFISLNLNIPLFNRFSVKNQVRNARINVGNQQLILENARKTLYKEIQAAYLNATAAREKYRASGKSVTASAESFKYARERYETGKSSVFEFNEAKTKLIQSQSEQIQAKYDYIFRMKILDFYNGNPIKL
ncbi:MAG: TolC family protein [Dysgonamonadaceae bacterium]|jgi:outer membrane protein|nr:TolC family protein [Dysgonamonadaceae bacterium]